MKKRILKIEEYFEIYRKIPKINFDKKILLNNFFLFENFIFVGNL